MAQQKLTLAEKANLSTTFTKSPIFDTTSEKLILRTILNNGEWFILVQNILSIDCFYNKDHRKMYKAILQANNKTGVVDLVTVSEQYGAIASQEKMMDVFGLSNFQATLDDSGFLSQRQFVAVAQALKRQHFNRELVRVANKHLWLNRKPENLKDVESLYSNFLEELQDIGSIIQEDQIESNLDLLHQLHDEILQPVESGIKGLTTGIHELDKLLNGLKEAEFINILAAPGTGKTVLMLVMLIHIVFELNEACVFVSYEMTRKQLLERIVSNIARINSRRLGTSHLSEVEKLQLNAAIQKIDAAIRDNKLILIEGKDKTPAQLHAETAILQAKYGVKALIVDYLNKIPADGYTKDQYDKLTKVSLAMSKIPVRLQMPVISAYQPDKEARKKQEPLDAESGRGATQVQDDSNVIIAGFRPANHRLTEWNGYEGEQLEKMFVLDVLKNRGGELGRVYAEFDGRYSLIKNSDNDFTPF